MKLKELQIEINDAIEMKDVVTLAYLANRGHQELIAEEMESFDIAVIEELTEKMEKFDVEASREAYREVSENYANKKKSDLLNVINKIANEAFGYK